MINSCCSAFYEMNLVNSSTMEGENNLYQSFMGNPSDDVDKIKQHWAFNMPCMLLVNGGE